MANLPTHRRNMSACLTALTTWGDLFTPRQLVALTTFSDLVAEAMERVERDAANADLPNDERPLRDGGAGATAYAEAVGVYLAFAIRRQPTVVNLSVSWERSWSMRDDKHFRTPSDSRWFGIMPRRIPFCSGGNFSGAFGLDKVANGRRSTSRIQVPAKVCSS